MVADYWRGLIAGELAGRDIVLTGSPVNAAGAAVIESRELGAARVFVLGEGMGTGSPPDAEWFCLPIDGDSIMEVIRAGQAVLRDLPDDARAALDRFDPDGEALVIGSFLNEAPEVAGRPCLAWRRPEWLALEDKVVVDELWDAAGVDRAPSRVVAVEDLAWRGSEVWAGDAREGFHGGAELTRWVTTQAAATASAAEMAAHCDRVRTMPFLEGIPCSIHGFVLAERVAALRPVEMITLRSGEQFFYAGAATYWDPPDPDREAMRDIARRVGAELRRRVDFRGAFTVDGVMTAGGFRPTELNPRLGAGLRALGRGLPQVPFDLLNQVIVSRPDLDYRPAEFEEVVLDAADRHRGGGTWRGVTTTLEPVPVRPLTWTGDGWRWAADDAPADGWVEAGASNLGGFIRLTTNAARTPAGPSLAPRAAAFYAFSDAELGTDIGALTPASDLRRA
ncbi:MAG: hypothetical protein H0W70_04490 [Actinobacteria bacterium]|nr:hypothetical protein [Actinomycetota bacterium]